MERMLLALGLSDFGESSDVSEATLSSYLQSLPLPYSFVIAAKINLLTSDGICQRPNEQDIVVNLLHRDGWFDDHSFAQIIANLRKPLPPKYEDCGEQCFRALFGRAQLLELMRMLAMLGTFESVEVRPANGRALLQASLAATELYANRRRPSSYSEMADEDRGDDEFLLKYMHIIRSGRVLASPNRDVLFAIARSKLLLQDRFFVDFPKYKILFKEATNIEVEDYLNSLICLVSAQLGQVEYKEQFTSLDRVLEGKFESAFKQVLPEKLSAINAFFTLEAQTLDDIRNSFVAHKEGDLSTVSTFRTLRDKPIFLTQSGNFIPIDQGFIIDKLCVGPLFHLLRQVDSNSLFQDFGESFESYSYFLLSSYCELSSNCGNERALVLRSPFGIKSSKERVEIADVAIRYASEIIFVESKAVWLPDTIMHVNDPKRFKHEVLKRYGSVGDVAGKQKGAAQLAGKIKDLIGRKIRPESQDLISDDIKKIFPILFVHDPNLSAPFFGEFLATHFMEMLGCPTLPSTGFTDINGYRVFSLFLITVDDFELFLEYGRRHRLCDWLEAYSNTNPNRFESCGSILAQAKEKTSELRSPITRAVSSALRSSAEAMFGRTSHS